MSKAYISIHTDGSSIGNPGPSGYGAVLKLRGHRKEIYGSLGHKTCNEAELLAVIKGLQAIKKSDQLITIYSDSQYVVKGKKGEWKVRTNQELWRTLHKEVEKHREVIFNWIPRQMNGEADKLARKGAEANG